MRRGPDGRILFDPYERTKEECILLGIASVVIFAIQFGVGVKLRRYWHLVGIGALLVLFHPGWTLRFATNMRSGDCGFLQMIGSIGFAIVHVAIVIAQLMHALWTHRIGSNERADYSDRFG